MTDAYFYLLCGVGYLVNFVATIFAKKCTPKVQESCRLISLSAITLCYIARGVTLLVLEWTK